MAIKKDNHRLETTDDIMTMKCVYASPEIMSGSSKSTSHDQTYPYVYADQDNNEDIIILKDVYGSPEKVYDSPFDEDLFINFDAQDKNKTIGFCGHCGKKVDSSWYFCESCGEKIRTAAHGVTAQFCLKCGKDNSLGNRFCVFCGNDMMPIKSCDEPNIPMGCVYASPERMSRRTEEEEVFFNISSGEEK